MNRHEFMQKKIDPPKVKKKVTKKKKPRERKAIKRGDSVCLTGAGAYTRVDYIDALEEIGIYVTPNVNVADVLVFSRTDTVKYDRAMERGLVAISYDQLEALLNL